MKYIHYIFLCCFVFILLKASAQSTFIEKKTFNEEKLAILINEKINNIRIENNLKPLCINSSLKKAALLQAIYIKKTKKVQLNQPGKSKSNTFKRVTKSKGTFAQVAENVFAYTFPDAKKVSRNKNNIQSYNDLAELVVHSWVNDKKSRNIIMSNLYYNTGIASVYNDKNKSIYISQVYASASFDFEDIKPDNKKAFNIKPYSKSKCNAFLTMNPNLSELLSNNIVVENNSLYLYYHDLSFFKNNFKKGKDAIAADILFKKQFDCSDGNKLYPSEVHNGILLKPIKKRKIFSSNKLKKSGELYIKIGKLPQAYDSVKAEVNLLIIKEGCLCQSIFFNNLDGENLSLLDLPMAMDTLSLKEKPDSVNKLLSFVVPFVRNKWSFNEEDIKPFLDSLELNRYNIKQIEITAYSSIEGDSIKNVQLQLNRANSILQAIEQYNLQKIEKKINTKENWDGFFESLKGSPYETKFSGLTKNQIRLSLLTDSLDFFIEPYLEDQRKVEVEMIVESVFIDSLIPHKLPEKFINAVNLKEIDKAKALQSLMYQNAIQELINSESTYEYDIPRQIENSSVLNNLLVFKNCFYVPLNTDSFRTKLKEEIIALYYINPLNPYVLYNKLLLELEFWSKDILSLPEPELLLKDMKKLYATRIENWKINRLVLNYHILAADYYYEKKDFSKREKELKEVRKFIFSSKLDLSQTYAMARYFIFQLRVDWAIDLMLPWIKSEKYDEDFLFIFLSVAIYDNKKVPEQEYISLMKKAMQINKNRFCNLFGYPKMSFQLLKNTTIKSEYCTHCNE